MPQTQPLASGRMCEHRKQGLILPGTLTSQSLEVRATLFVCAYGVFFSSFPVSPGCDILQSLVELSILHVFGADYASSSNWHPQYTRN